jgi:hypothetical protein
MDLNSGQVITRNIVHEIPVTDVVIKAVETMAYDQGFKSMKFANRNGVVFFDTDWIAGVDYEEDDKKSSGKRTRALNIHYFFLTDQVEKGNLPIEYFPADKEMVGAKSFASSEMRYSDANSK